MSVWSWVAIGVLAVWLIVVPVLFGVIGRRIRTYRDQEES